MEKIIVATEKIWAFCFLASFTGCLALLLCQNISYRKLIFWSGQSCEQSLSIPNNELNMTSSLSTFPSLINSSFQDIVVNGRSKTELLHHNKYSLNSSQEGINTGTIDHGCNIFDGVWVHEASPMYHGWQCPFLSNQVSCQRNGRSDFEYEYWSWEAKGCQIPRFNGTDMLERLRGKRVVIAGDSLNRNQWESLACLLYSSLPASKVNVDYRSSVYKIFHAKDYDCYVEFFWAPFLIQLDVHPETGSRILRLDKLTNSAKLWKGADVMVFNTGHWWVHSGKSRAWDFFEHKGKLLPDMSTESAFHIAMTTWARWIDKNVNITKTVYFRSISPEHKGIQWCYNQTEPIRNESFSYNFPRPILEVITNTLRKMKTPVRYLNITKLSGYRKDAHPSVYAIKERQFVVKEKNNQQHEYKGDCSHWCLPGVPDTWNRLIYGDLVSGYLNSSPGLSS